jgi:hypothetical protein
LLEATYPGRWIGRRGPIAWHPWSPDLTPIFLYFLWGHLKEHGDAVPLGTNKDLVARFQATMTTIDDNMLRRLRGGCRLAHCRLP